MMKVAVMMTAILGLMHTGCGLSKRDSGSGDRDPDTAVGLLLGAMAQSKINHQGKEALWSAALEVNEVGMFAFEKGTLADLRARLEEQRISPDDKLKLTLSIISGVDDSLLATNSKDEAYATPASKQIWDKDCQKVSPDVAESASGNRSELVEVDGQKFLKLQLSLCDIGGILVIPTVEIKPANNERELRHVVYTCEYKTEGQNQDPDEPSVIYLHDIHQECRVGYIRPSQGALIQKDVLGDRKIETPEGAEPLFKIYTNNGKAIVKNDSPDLSRKYILANRDLVFSTVDQDPMPFGSYKDCHTLEWELYYKDQDSTSAGTSREMRVVWERQINVSTGTFFWKALDQTVLPPAIQVQAVNAPSGRFYLHCTWENTEGFAVQTVGVSGN